MEIIVNATATACHNFTVNNDERIKTVIIAPISITKETNRIKIAYACNIGQICENENCVYSRVRHESDFSYRNREE